MRLAQGLGEQVEVVDEGFARGVVGVVAGGDSGGGDGVVVGGEGEDGVEVGDDVFDVFW